MNPKRTEKSGRVAFDERGNPIWEWRTDSGSFRRDIDTGKLKTLYSDQLSLTDPGGEPLGFDPYNSPSQPLGDPDSSAKPRRSIDDLRKLSEEIKRLRRLKESEEHPDVASE